MQAIDVDLIRVMIGWGQAVPIVWTIVRGLTELGGSAWLIPLTLVVAAWLKLQGHGRRGAALLLVSFGGRALVELIKWLIGRPRPALVDFPVVVHSLSFPSGHASNAMIVYLALALIVGRLRTDRSWPVALAVALSLVIGFTRPILGVHWPSDILAGWALGVAWTLSSVWLLDNWMKGRPVSRPPASG